MKKSLSVIIVLSSLGLNACTRQHGPIPSCRPGSVCHAERELNKQNDEKIAKLKKEKEEELNKIKELLKDKTTDEKKPVELTKEDLANSKAELEKLVKELKEKDGIEINSVFPNCGTHSLHVSVSSKSLTDKIAEIRKPKTVDGKEVIVLKKEAVTQVMKPLQTLQKAVLEQLEAISTLKDEDGQIKDVKGAELANLRTDLTAYKTELERVLKSLEVISNDAENADIKLEEVPVVNDKGCTV